MSNAASEASVAVKKFVEEEQQFEIQQQPKNYFKAVSENKDVSKLVSLLSTAINSNKKVS